MRTFLENINSQMFFPIKRLIFLPVKIAVASHILKKDINEVILNMLSNNTPRLPDMSPPPPTY